VFYELRFASKRSHFEIGVYGKDMRRKHPQFTHGNTDPENRCRFDGVTPPITASKRQPKSYFGEKISL
jgi:hypothetical protein